MIRCKTIFLTSGHTFTFRNIRNVVDNETTITFEYTAMSDGKPKAVTFYKSAGAVGHSEYESTEKRDVERPI